MTIVSLVRHVAIIAVLSGCASSPGSQTSCLGETSDTCTTKEARYKVSAKRFETVEHESGCASRSGAVCNRWLDTSKPENRAVIDTNKRMDDYLHGPELACARNQASCGNH